MLFKECLLSPFSADSSQRKLVILFCCQQYGWACTERNCIAFEIFGDYYCVLCIKQKLCQAEAVVEVKYDSTGGHNNRWKKHIKLLQVIVKANPFTSSV